MQYFLHSSFKYLYISSFVHHLLHHHFYAYLIEMPFTLLCESLTTMSEPDQTKHNQKKIGRKKVLTKTKFEKKQVFFLFFFFKSRWAN